MPSADHQSITRRALFATGLAAPLVAPALAATSEHRDRAAVQRWAAAWRAEGGDFFEYPRGQLNVRWPYPHSAALDELLIDIRSPGFGAALARVLLHP